MAISLSTSVSGRKEPKRSNRFILKFTTVPGAGALPFEGDNSAQPNESLAIDLLSAARPTISFGSDNTKRFNETWNFPTAPTWETLPVVYYDYEKGQSSASQIMWKWAKTVYDVLNGTMGYAAHYKTDASLIILGPGQLPTGNSRSGAPTSSIQAIEVWDIFGIYPDNVTFGSLSYDSTEIMKVNVTFRFDYANMQELSSATVNWTSIS